MHKDSLLLFFAVNYACQGLSGIVFEPLSYLLKDGLGLGPAESAAFVTLMTLPFLFKPLLGAVSDLFPVGRFRRRPHLIAVCALSAAAWGALVLRPDASYWPLLALVLLANVGLVSSDAVCDAVMVERGRPSGRTGLYQSVQIGTLYATIVVTGLGGGWLSAHLSVRWAFGLAALFSLLTLVSAAWIEEAPAARSWSRGVEGLRTLLTERRFWAVSGLIFLWSFAPFLGTAQFYYQSDGLGLSPVQIGGLGTLGGGAGVAGAALYGKVLAKRWPLETVVRASVPMGIGLSLIYLIYAGPWTAAAVTVVAGVAGTALRLALMDLAARSAAPGAEAASFAAFMAVFNLAASASNALGGKLYAAWQPVWGAFGASAGLCLLGAASTAACWGLVSAAVYGTMRRPPR